MNTYELLRHFDPSSTSCAASVAAEAVRLMRLVSQVVSEFDDNVRVGRDLQTRLSGSMLTLGQRLGIMNESPDCAGIEWLCDQLMEDKR